MKLEFFAAALVLLALPAAAQTDGFGRALACTGTGPVTCTADGITITNTTLDTVVGAFSALAPPGYTPPARPLVEIAPLDFMARLTPAEQTAIATAGQSNAQVLLFLLTLAGATTVNVTDALTQAGVQAMVAANLLTQARGAQILDLAQISP